MKFASASASFTRNRPSHIWFRLIFPEDRTYRSFEFNRHARLESNLRSKLRNRLFL